jgi:hypothetical protein
MAALEAGFDCRALCELACEPLPNHWEINTVFERALRDCSVPIPATDAAVEYVLRADLQAIACGDIEPRQGMCGVVNDLYHPHIAKQPPRKYGGDQRGLHHLIGAFYSYDDLYERSTEVSFGGYMARLPFPHSIVTLDNSPMNGFNRMAATPSMRAALSLESRGASVRTL